MSLTNLSMCPHVCVCVWVGVGVYVGVRGGGDWVVGELRARANVLC